MIYYSKMKFGIEKAKFKISEKTSQQYKPRILSSQNFCFRLPWQDEEWTFKLLALLRIWPHSLQGKNWLCTSFLWTFSRLSLAFFFPHWSHEYSFLVTSSSLGCLASSWSLKVLSALNCFSQNWHSKYWLCIFTWSLRSFMLAFNFPHWSQA